MRVGVGGGGGVKRPSEKEIHFVELVPRLI